MNSKNLLLFIILLLLVLIVIFSIKIIEGMTKRKIVISGGNVVKKKLK